jgi:membrane associated rhomboid family serine protease
MPKITDTVKHLLIINVLVYFATNMLMGEPSSSIPENTWEWGREALALFSPSSTYFKPYQIVSHLFMHSGLNHLFFNMFALYMFGTALETYWGAKKFLIYYLFTGFGAMVLHMIVLYVEAQYMGADGAGYLEYSRSWGASGSVFGLLAGFGMLFPNNVIQLIIPPIALKAKYFVLIYAGLELFLGFSGMNTGIAHFAHLGGALFGVLIILYWRKTDNRWLK